MPAHAVVRRRLEDQGFHLDDAALAEVASAVYNKLFRPRAAVAAPVARRA